MRLHQPNNKASLHGLKRQSYRVDEIKYGEQGVWDDPRLIVPHHGVGFATGGLPVSKDRPCMKPNRKDELYM